MIQTNTERVYSALRYIDPADRETWLRMGMAVKSELGDDGFYPWDEWAQAADNHKAADARTVWKSISTEGGIGIGTLFHTAKENGWHDKPQAKPHPKTDHARPLGEPEKPKPNTANLNAVWERGQPAKPSHAYAVKKGATAPLDGLRVLPDSDALSIGGQPMAGALIVPAYDNDGALQTLQLIPPEGKKMNLAGCPMAGGRFVVGTIKAGSPLYVCEGIGQAWACWQATGCAAVVCFGWSNIKAVASDLRQAHKTARMVIVPDAGKEQDAQAIAKAIGAAVAHMPQGEAANFDANDLAQRDGKEALAKLLAAAQSFEPESCLKRVSVGDVLSNPSPPPQYVWRGYIPRGVVTLLGAHGGTGKSTIALMLAVAVATGQPLFGIETEPERVLFVSLEDGAGLLRHRLKRICEVWGIDPEQLEGRLFLVDGVEHPELFTAEGKQEGSTTDTYNEVESLVQDIGAGLLIVDNASDAFGGDEIQRRAVRGFIRCLAKIARDNHAGCLLLSHVDKGTSRKTSQDTESYSGSTAWNNSVRSRLFMARADDGTLTLTQQKNNLGAMAARLKLHWPEDGLPDLDPLTLLAGWVDRTTDGSAGDKADTQALLRLIAEFTERGEKVSPAPNSPTKAASLLSQEKSYPKHRKPKEIAHLLRGAQRNKHLEIETYRTADRKPKEAWQVTPEGRAFAELPPVAPSAPSAPSASIEEDGADGAERAPSAPSA